MLVRIGLSRPRKFNLISWLIQKVERTDFSHAFIEWFIPATQQLVVIHAGFSGIELISSDKFFSKNKGVEFYTYALSSPEIPLSRMIELLGTRYGYFDVFKLFLKRFLGRYFGLRFHDTGYTCVEVAVEFLIWAYSIRPPTDKNEMGLKELQEYLRELQDLFLEEGSCQVSH